MHSVRRVNRSHDQAAAIKAKELVEIEKLKHLNQRVQASLQNFEENPDPQNAEKLKDATTALLKSNAENYTIWNYRRRAIMANQSIELLTSELSLLEQLFVQWPKVYWLWNHRSWVLEQMGADAPWDREFKLVSKLLTVDARNFHGWHYRRHIYDILESQCEQVEKKEKLAKDEIDFTTSKINANFSNYSAWHHRSQLLSKNPEPLSDEITRKELHYCREAVLMDPEDQSAWQYYRWILLGPKCPPHLSASLITSEITELEQLYAEEPDSKWCVYTLWTLSQKAGVQRPDLLKALERLDPLRQNRYKHLEESISSACRR